MQDNCSLHSLKNFHTRKSSQLIPLKLLLFFSAPENEATLPVIFSMFEFTKEEQDKLQEARMNFN